ncbi:MAG: hypothetical protein HYY61_02090 [Deltaproteobacteria bacterium]|nr:hypothetical protein [Deltaproteobacteria bacterium]
MKSYRIAFFAILLISSFLFSLTGWADTKTFQRGEMREVSMIKSENGQFNVLLHTPNRTYHFGWVEAGKLVEASQVVTNLKRCTRITITATLIPNSASAYNVTEYQMYF